MRLWTTQSLEVAAILVRDGCYLPDWNLVQCPYWPDSYAWLRDAYNSRKGTAHEGPPVFWYTEWHQVRDRLADVNPNEILLVADVPEELVFRHDFVLWHHVLNRFALDFTSDDYAWRNKAAETRTEAYMDRLFEKRAEAGDDPAHAIWRHVEATWGHALHLAKRDRAGQEIHATTPFILREWLRDFPNGPRLPTIGPEIPSQ